MQLHNKISNSNTKYRVTEQKLTEKFQILFCCFKFCFTVSNSILLFQILFCCLDWNAQLDFIIYDNCNTLLKFIQIFSTKYCKFLQCAKQNGCSGRCIGEMVCLPDAYRFWRLKCYLKIKTIVAAVHQMQVFQIFHRGHPLAQIVVHDVLETKGLFI